MQRTLRMIFPQWQGGTGPDYTLDAYPDISNTDIFPNGNSMVVGNLMGKGDPGFAARVKRFLTPDQFLYCGVLESTTPEEQKLVDASGIKVVPPSVLIRDSQPLKDWIEKNKFQYMMVHLDVDVIKPELFHSNVFEKPEPISTDCSHGEMSFSGLTRLFQDIKEEVEFVGFTITEHLPWDMMDLKKFLSDFPIFSEQQ